MLVQNVFDISDLVIFSKILNQPGTLFLQNTFKISSHQDVHKLHKMILEAPNVLMSKILVDDKPAEGSTYQDLVKGQVAQGFTPMTWLTT